MTTYRITTLFVMSDPMAILRLVMPAFSGETLEYSDRYITVTFATPQTPADLGPLVRVEILPPDSL